MTAEGRFELKYAVPVALRETILAMAEGHVHRDRHAVPLRDGTVGYEVHSVYLDSPDIEDFVDRLGERKVRNRLRARTYGPRGSRVFPVFLENKRKLDNRVVKARTRVCLDAEAWCGHPALEPWLALGEGLTGNDRFVLRDFHRLCGGGRRVPVSVVHYEREVFVDRDEDRRSRLTLDRNVRATTRNVRVQDLFAPADVDLLPPDWMVVEMKFGGTAPGWMRQLVRELRLRAIPVSKFGLSVALGVAGGRSREVRYLVPRPVRRLLFAGAAAGPTPPLVRETAS